MKKSFISLSLILFFLANILSVYFISKGNFNDIKNSSIEQIFSTIQQPINMLLQNIDNKTKNNTNNKKEKNSKKDNLEEYMLSPNIINISENSSISFTKTITHLYLSVFINTDIEYPLKIPFYSFIFILLILKLLFSILPRSISIYNIKNIEEACIA